MTESLRSSSPSWSSSCGHRIAPRSRRCFALWPRFLSYALSFVYLGIYWNNHHHLLRAAKTIDGRVMWANLNLLFWLSLVPFGTAWIGENSFASFPLAVYGALLILPAIAYFHPRPRPDSRPGHPEPVCQRHSGATSRARSRSCSIAFDPAGALSPEPHGPLRGLAAIWIVPDRRFEPTVATGSVARARPDASR